MTALTVLQIVELPVLDSRLATSLSGSDSIIAHLSATASQITYQTLVMWPHASLARDSARADRPKNPIQTP